MSILRTILISCTFISISTSVFANEYYAEVGITQSTAELEVPSRRDDLLANNIDVEASTPLTLFRMSAGIVLNPYFSVEGMLATGLAEEDVLSGPAIDNNGNTVIIM